MGVDHGRVGVDWPEKAGRRRTVGLRWLAVGVVLAVADLGWHLVSVAAGWPASRELMVIGAGSRAVGAVGWVCLVFAARQFGWVNGYSQRVRDEAEAKHAALLAKAGVVL